MTALLVDGTKTCTACGVEKPLDAFYRSKAGRLGRASRCKPCQNAATAVCRRKRPEQQREYDRAWYAANKHKARAYNLMKLYGITVEQYDAMEAEQEGCCALCRRLPEGRGTAGRLHVDHDHETGIVRRLLCHDCNNGLGRFLDDPDLLRRAADYVESFR